MHLLRQRAARELDPSADTSADLAARHQPCPKCNTQAGLACGVCGGLGHVLAKDRLEEIDAGRHEWCGQVEDFLAAWIVIEKHGVAGFLRMHADGDEEAQLDPLFVDAFELFSGELGRLEHEARIEEAKGQRGRLKNRNTPGR